MGKWAEVACNCPDRMPLPGSDSLFDRPHRKQSRLTAEQQQEVERWEQTTMNMFACGHRHGMLIELWPGDIIHLGELLGTAGGVLEHFWTVGARMSYDNNDELLLLTPEEAEWWLQEIDEVRQALDGGGGLARTHLERTIEGFVDYERRLDKHPVYWTEQDLQATPMYTERAMKRIREALDDAASLCHASIRSGNPIRLMW
jgi:hypothetical protein